MSFSGVQPIVIRVSCGPGILILSILSAFLQKIPPVAALQQQQILLYCPLSATTVMSYLLSGMSGRGHNWDLFQINTPFSPAAHQSSKELLWEWVYPDTGGWSGN